MNHSSKSASSLSGGDPLPWCTPDIVAGCEKEVAEAANGTSDGAKSDGMRRLSWALVHSRQPDDVQRGIAMFEASIDNSNNPIIFEKKEKLYLLAVGYYRSGDFSRSRELLEQCLQVISLSFTASIYLWIW